MGTSRGATSPLTPRTSPPPVLPTSLPRSLSSTTPDRFPTATLQCLIATPPTLPASSQRSWRRWTGVPASPPRTRPSSSSLVTPPSSSCSPSRPPPPRRLPGRPPRLPRRPTRRSEPMAAGAGLFLGVGTWSRATCTSIGKSSAGYPVLPVRCLLLSILVQTWHSVSCLNKKIMVVGSFMALLDALCLTRYLVHFNMYVLATC